MVSFISPSIRSYQYLPISCSKVGVNRTLSGKFSPRRVYVVLMIYQDQGCLRCHIGYPYQALALREKLTGVLYIFSNQNGITTEWLEREEDIAIGSFTEEDSLPKDKAVAEEEFQFAVEDLNKSEDSDLKRWANSIINTNFRCLQTTETAAYWSSLAITNGSKEDIVLMNSMKFKNSTVNNFKKRAAPSIETGSQPRKHITVEDNDGVVLDGLSVSLFSHLKTIATNKLYNFNNQAEKEQYYTTMTMNNVLDLSNKDNNDQISSISTKQVQELMTKYEFQEPPCHYVDSCKSFIKDHALKMITSRIYDNADPDDISIMRIYREVLENHLPMPEKFNESRKGYSKMDHILNFWRPINNNLFMNTDVWSHWGDTESENCKYKFRMDLRLLGQSINNLPDHGRWEFARSLTVSEYYHDNKKLVLNGTIQLDSILEGWLQGELARCEDSSLPKENVESAGISCRYPHIVP